MTRNRISKSKGEDLLAGASDLHNHLRTRLIQLGVPFHQEVSIEECGRHRWDFAIEFTNVLVEVQGGTHMKERTGHSTGTGLARDYKKNNLAVKAGWAVLYFDAKQVVSDEAALVIEAVVKTQAPNLMLKPGFFMSKQGWIRLDGAK